MPWIPCSVLLPERDTRVLVFGYSHRQIAKLTDEHLWLPDDECEGVIEFERITHWLPLPGVPGTCVMCKGPAVDACETMCGTCLNTQAMMEL